MSRRIDIEITSARDDGGWTWRAAGAKNPRGVVAAGTLPGDIAVGSVLKVEVEQGLDSIEIVQVLSGRERRDRDDRLEILGHDEEFVPVIETRARRERGERRDGDRRRRRRDDGEGRKDGDRRRNDGDRRRDGATGGRDDDGRRGRRDGDGGNDRRQGRGRGGPRFTPPPEMPQRPKPKRLRPGRQHRTAVLADLPAEQQPIAELALKGMAAVRSRLAEENTRLAAEGRAVMPDDTVMRLAENLLPRLRVAEWRDRADAALATADQVDMRDLRSVLTAAGDPSIARDSSTSAIVEQLREALARRQEQELQLWFADVDAALAIGRVIRALRLSSQPPKAGVVFPADIATRLLDSTNATLTPIESPDRWIAVLEAAAFSPIRKMVTPMGAPTTVTDELRATVERIGPAMPQIAAMFGVEVPEGAPMPRPLRTGPPRRDGQGGASGGTDRRRKGRRGESTAKTTNEAAASDATQTAPSSATGASDDASVDVASSMDAGTPAPEAPAAEDVTEDVVVDVTENVTMTDEEPTDDTGDAPAQDVEAAATDNTGGAPTGAADDTSASTEVTVEPEYATETDDDTTAPA